LRFFEQTKLLDGAEGKICWGSLTLFFASTVYAFSWMAASGIDAPSVIGALRRINRIGTKKFSEMSLVIALSHGN